jgi:dihydrofolate reductase
VLNEEIRRLKQQAGGDIRLSGSATLAQSLMQAGLVDAHRGSPHMNWR